MTERVEKIRQMFLQSKGMLKQIDSDLTGNKNKLRALNNRIKLLEQAQAFLQKIAQSTQEKLKLNVEDIVNLALETCFPNEYVFKLNFIVARGKTDAELVFLSQKTGRELDPMNTVGCGIIDVTSFALRLACYTLLIDTDNVIILDEPMKFVSKDLLGNVSELIKKLSHKLNLQMIMVTHETQFVDVADKVFEVKKNPDGRSVVKVRKNI